MEAHELMIGNTIDKGTIVNMLESGVHVGYGKCYTYDEISPIPLTEEWLLSFGFVESQDIDTIFGLKLNDFWYINEFQIRNKFNAILLEVELKYVHQLQNLYFALTRTHLTLK